jgi:hypothetical protein
MVKKCSFCGTLNPDDANYCVNCNGALKFSSRFRSWGLRAKHAPTRVKTWGKKKALSVIGGAPERKAAKAAAPEAGMYPEARGIYGQQKQPRQAGAGAGKRGKGIAILLVIIAVLLFFLQLFGMFPRYPIEIFIAFEMILLFLAIISAVLVSFSGSVSAAISIFVIILILSFVSNWFTTPLGQQKADQLGIGGIQASESLRAVTGPLNVMGQIFQGTYNPENLWRSDVVESEYQEVKDVGVKIISAESIRDAFDISQIPVIQGRVDAVSFPNKEVTVSMDAREIDAVTGYDMVGAVGWTCDYPFTKITEARNRPFTCEAQDKLKAGPHAIEISAYSEGTQTVAGKQFVFIDPNILLAMEPGADVLKELDINKDSVKSWQTGDDSINLGIGVSGDYDVLETGSLDYYLGLNIENPASHTGTATITTIELFVPSTTPGNIDFTCKDATADDFANLNLQGYENLALKKCYVIGTIELTPGNRENKFIKIKLDPKELNNQDFSTFFVLARVEFGYENMKTVPVLVRELTGP